MVSENYSVNITKFNLPFSAQQAYVACLEALRRLELFRNIKGEENSCRIIALSKDEKCDEIVVLKVISLTSSSCEIEMMISDELVCNLIRFNTKVQNLDNLIKIIKNEIFIIMEDNKQVGSNRGTALLNRMYDIVLNGLPMVSEPVTDLVKSYTNKYGYSEKSIKKFVNNQILKCSATGFLTGLGGLLTLPVSIPADLAGSLYVELRMIVGIAIIRGYNPYDDAVKTAVYLCLIGNAATTILNDVGIKIANSIAYKKLLPLLSRKVTTKINGAIGRRVITKAGTKGIINGSKLVPIVGGVVSAIFNGCEVASFAKIAKKRFDRE